MNPKPDTKPGQVWLVDYECREAVIVIAPKNNGFFAPGQEPLWHFSNVADWHKCLHELEQ
jgi:hypothetical protein